MSPVEVRVVQPAAREKRSLDLQNVYQKGLVSMECSRCDGFMIAERQYDQDKEDACAGRFGARCINCGNVEDAVIRRNRVVRPSLRNEPRGGTVERGGIFIC
jgi:hypothetical protein